MPKDEQAKKAINELDGAEIDERSITVKKAEEKKQGPRRGGDFRGDYGGSSGYNKDNPGARGRKADD